MVTLPGLEGFLRRHKRIGLDSNILIYFIEAHPKYHGLVEKIFESFETGGNLGVCSTLSLLEVLVQPYRKNDDEMVNQFYALLTTYPNLTWLELSVEIADLAARLRARYHLKTPDAVLLATAVYSGATGFVGNDEQLKRVTDLDILLLSQ
ncbi:MAG: PIN domain-containing protein [Candidatus Tectomicrobia bacterium]|uniref:PIN domain-containing protein n=1 Tax=Tectimicrobiota bacterium TaxID=2528274 RepID=A0A932M2E0_UNCTE|nr:PIN domain-containing protein [Candidatus Tectomicrobia bacterium]